MLDRFSKSVLLVIAILLAVLAIRPLAQPTTTVRAQSQAADGFPFYVEPGYTMIRKPDGTAQMYGKMVIDMRNGDIWGFPTSSQSPYPIDMSQPKPPKSSPIYLGKFIFDQAVR